MRAAAKIVLLVINTIWVLVGLGMCIGGGVAYTWTARFEGLIDSTSIMVVAIIGGFLFLVGLLGFYSVFHLGCKSLQFVYSILVLVLAVGMAAAGGAILSYLGVVGGDATGIASANEAQETSKALIDNYLNCMYKQCCMSNATDTATVAIPSATPSSAGAECDGGRAGKIQEGVCSSLEQIDLKACMGTVDQFKTGIQEYISGYLRTFMMAVFGVAGLQFVGFIIALCFVLTEYTGGDKISPNYEA